MNEQPSLRTPIWQLVGLFGNRPGLLELAGGRLAFTTDEGQVFDAPLSEVTAIKFPWYYFGGGMKLRVGAARYRFSFVRPNGAEDIPGRLLAREGDAVAALLTAGRKIADIGTGRQAGKAWKSVLGAQTFR
jgi:hypothetical protein